MHITYLSASLVVFGISVAEEADLDCLWDMEDEETVEEEEVVGEHFSGGHTRWTVWVWFSWKNKIN